MLSSPEIQQHAGSQKYNIGKNVPSMPKPTLYAKLSLAVAAFSLNTEYGTLIPLFGSPKRMFCVKFHAVCTANAHQRLSI